MRAAERVRWEDGIVILDTRLMPDCAWCSAAKTLEPLYRELGATVCTCSCCGKTTRIDSEGVAHQVRPPLSAIDVNGHQMFDP